MVDKAIERKTTIKHCFSVYYNRLNKKMVDRDIRHEKNTEKGQRHDI